MIQPCLNYSILQFVSGHEKLSDRVEPYYPSAVKEYLKNIYLFNAFHDTIKERFMYFFTQNNSYWSQ